MICGETNVHDPLWIQASEWNGWAMTSRSNRARTHVLPAYTTLFKALSDETRLRIFLLLKEELCVCQIQVALAMSQTKVSRHLTVLRNAGLVTARRDGLWMYYSRAVPESPPLRRFVQQLAARLEDDPDLMASVVSDQRYAILPLRRSHEWRRNNCNSPAVGLFRDLFNSIFWMKQIFLNETDTIIPSSWPWMDMQVKYGILYFLYRHILHYRNNNILHPHKFQYNLK